jgi:hypothetical protein
LPSGLYRLVVAAQDVPAASGRVSTTEFSTGPSPDLQRMKLLLPSSLCRRYRGRHSLGAIKPATELDPGFLEHLRLSPRAPSAPEHEFERTTLGKAQRLLRQYPRAALMILIVPCCRNGYVRSTR